jgi:hypothetical protein
MLTELSMNPTIGFSLCSNELLIVATVYADAAIAGVVKP